MKSRTLSAVGVGDVPQWLADEGLELAAKYFEENDLDPIACFEAKLSSSGSALANHWDQADLIANKVLLADSRYENSMINLDLE
jgi:hypothetical protein